MDGVRLRDFEFRLALGTAQDLAFLDFILIHIDFGGTFRATNHGSILRTIVHTGDTRTVSTPASVLYTVTSNFNLPAVRGLVARHRRTEWE